MFQTFRMAWRNIWRNTRRTLLTGSAIGLGFALVVFFLTLVDGLLGNVFTVATDSMIGHAQVHAQDYAETRDVERFMPDGASVLNAVENTSGVSAASPRARGTGVLSIGDRSQLTQLIGIDPTREPQVTNWKSRIKKGRYIEKPGEVMIGHELAKKLEVELDTRLVLSVADIKTGESDKT